MRLFTKNRLCWKLVIFINFENESLMIKYFSYPEYLINSAFSMDIKRLRIPRFSMIHINAWKFNFISEAKKRPIYEYWISGFQIATLSVVKIYRGWIFFFSYNLKIFVQYIVYEWRVEQFILLLTKIGTKFLQNFNAKITNCFELQIHNKFSNQYLEARQFMKQNLTENSEKFRSLICAMIFIKE